MNRHHSHHTPDFFVVLLVLVVIGFGLTLAIQIGAGGTGQVVNGGVIKNVQDAG